jgi:D-alanine-D-alanine ligase
MLIGLTYDLRQEYLAMGYSEEDTAEFDRPDTIDAIEKELQKLGHATDRIGHVRNLCERLVRGDRWDLVFNIAEGLRGVGREAQVPAILDAYEIPYTFSDGLVSALSLHKGMTKHVLRGCGLPTPDFAVVETTEEVSHVKLPYPLFVKPVAEGTAKGIDARSRVTSAAQLRDRCEFLLLAFHQPVLVETFLPGREFTTGIIGTGHRARVIGTLEVELLPDAEPDAYTYVNKERCEELCRYTIVDDTDAKACEAVALEAWRAMGCRDAGRVDLRLDSKGQPHILELNPLSGLHPQHSDLPIMCTQLGTGYHDLIAHIVESAARRVPGYRPTEQRRARTR